MVRFKGLRKISKNIYEGTGKRFSRGTYYKRIGKNRFKIIPDIPVHHKRTEKYDNLINFLLSIIFYGIIFVLIYFIYKSLVS